MGFILGILFLRLLSLATMLAPPPPVFTPIPRAAGIRKPDVATPAPTATAAPTPDMRHVVTVPSPLEEASAIVATLSFEKGDYRAGESIKIAMTLHNAGRSSFAVPPLPPWSIVHLVVSNQAGKVVEASGTQYRSSHASTVSSHLERLAPGGTQALSWQGATAFDLTEWNIRLGAGRYTVRAIPRVENPASTTDTSIRSNTVRLIVH